MCYQGDALKKNEEQFNEELNSNGSGKTDDKKTLEDGTLTEQKEIQDESTKVSPQGSKQEGNVFILPCPQASTH